MFADELREINKKNLNIIANTELLCHRQDLKNAAANGDTEFEIHTANLKTASQQLAFSELLKKEGFELFGTGNYYDSHDTKQRIFTFHVKW